jgi:uncharacterized protein YodC (DUF2158 family)
MNRLSETIAILQYSTTPFHKVNSKRSFLTYWEMVVIYYILHRELLMRACFLFVFLFLLILFCPDTQAEWTTPDTIFDGIVNPFLMGEEYDGQVSPVLAVAADSDHNIHLIWSESDSLESEIFYTCLHQNEWTTPKNISNIKGLSIFPSIALSADGMVHCAWTEWDENLITGFYNSKVSHQDWLASTKLTDSPATSTFPVLVFDSKNNLYCGQTLMAEKPAIYFQMQHPDGGWSPFPSTPVTSKPFRPAFLFDNDNVLHCIWYDGSYPKRSVSYSLYDGSNWSFVQEIAAGDVMDDFPLSFVMDSKNTLYCMFFAYNQNRGIWYSYKTEQGSWNETIKTGFKGYNNRLITDAANRLYFEPVG